MSNAIDFTPDTSPFKQYWLPLDQAIDRVVKFERQFGTSPLDLACHAALPSILTPELVNLIRINFLEKAVDWIAESDLLLSSLCQPINRGIFEIEPQIRQVLLVALQTRPDYGPTRLGEVADFLHSYNETPLANKLPTHIKRTYQWISGAYLDPDITVQNMFDLLKEASADEFTSKMPDYLHIGKTLALIANPLEMTNLQVELEDLTKCTQLTALYWTGDSENARHTLKNTDYADKVIYELTSPIADWLANSGWLKVPEPATTTITSSEFKPQQEPVAPQPLRPRIPGTRNIVKCICPSCFEEFDLRACDIVSGVTSGKVLKRAPRLPLFQISLEPLDSPHYTREQAHRRCPHCQYLLPYNIERVHNISLSVVGDVHSGKSHYIASLVYQLTREWGRNTTSGSLQIECLTPDIEKDFKQRYIGPLFSQKKTVPPTQGALHRNLTTPQPMVDHPLIYNIRIRPSDRHPPRTFNLLIYETSGEDFREMDRMVRLARFALNSSAFIFVADPFSMDTVFRDLLPSLQSRVPSALQPANGASIAGMQDMVLASLRCHHGRSAVSRQTDIPIAVMVSKADIFTKGLQHPYSNLSLNHYPQYDFRVDLDDLNNIHEEVKRLLTHYKQNRIISSTNALGTCQFFATSATSTPPDWMGHYSSVKPWRCLDPLLWIFYEYGFIKKI